MCCLPRCGDQALWLPKRLDETKDDARARLIEQVVGVVAPSQVDFVAGADHAADSQAAILGVVEQGEGQSAALRHHGNRSGLCTGFRGDKTVLGIDGWTEGRT